MVESINARLVTGWAEEKGLLWGGSGNVGKHWQRDGRVDEVGVVRDAGAPRDRVPSPRNNDSDR